MAALFWATALAQRRQERVAGDGETAVKAWGMSGALVWRPIRWPESLADGVASRAEGTSPPDRSGVNADRTLAGTGIVPDRDHFTRLWFRIIARTDGPEKPIHDLAPTAHGMEMERMYKINGNCISEIALSLGPGAWGLGPGA